jgi:hypothetical protein
LTNPDMAKKAISRNMRITDPEAVEEVYQRTVAVYERLPTVPKAAKQWSSFQLPLRIETRPVCWT